MSTDRRKISKDLITNRNLWETVFAGDVQEGGKHFVRLRDLEYSPGLNVLYVGVKENKKEAFEKLVQRWNLLAIQFSPDQNSSSNLIAELWVE